MFDHTTSGFWLVLTVTDCRPRCHAAPVRQRPWQHCGSLVARWWLLAVRLAGSWSSLRRLDRSRASVAELSSCGQEGHHRMMTRFSSNLLPLLLGVQHAEAVQAGLDLWPDQFSCRSHAVSDSLLGSAVFPAPFAVAPIIALRDRFGRPRRARPGGSHARSPQRWRGLCPLALAHPPPPARATRRGAPPAPLARAGCSALPD